MEVAKSALSAKDALHADVNAMRRMMKMNNMVFTPCRRCGKTPRADYYGFCMDCADELGISEVFHPSEMQIAKAQAQFPEVPVVAREYSEALLKRLMIMPCREFAIHIANNTETDSRVVPDARTLMREALQKILTAKDFTFNMKEIIPFMINTKNKIYNRPLPFWNCFIDETFELEGLDGHRMIVKGIRINSVNERTKTWEENPNWNDPDVVTGIYANMIILNPNGVAEDLFYWFNMGDAKRCLENKMYLGNDTPNKVTMNFAHQIETIVCNFLDFINQPEVSVNEIYTDPKQNEKRANRGKIPLAMIRDYVIVDHFAKKYLSESRGTEHAPYSHRFWVKGHWMNLRSPRYKTKRGMRIWVQAFVKGQGILVEKRYIVKGESPDNHG